jgi:cellobiose phosphorylase
VSCIPPEWKTFKLSYRYRDTLYRITVLHGRFEEGEAGVTLDGIAQPGESIPLVDDRRDHSVEVRINATSNVMA